MRERCKQAIGEIRTLTEASGNRYKALPNALHKEPFKELAVMEDMTSFMTAHPTPSHRRPDPSVLPLGSRDEGEHIG